MGWWWLWKVTNSIIKHRHKIKFTFMIHDSWLQCTPRKQCEKQWKNNICMYVCMYYQCHENGVCRNGFDGFRLYHDSTIWDSLKRSRRFHTITCRGLFQRRSQTVSDYIRFFDFFGWFSVKRSRRFLTLMTFTVGNGLDGFSTHFFCYHGSSYFLMLKFKNMM